MDANESVVNGASNGAGGEAGGHDRLKPVPAAERRDPFERRDVAFLSDGVACAGWYYVPSDLVPGEPRPAVVMAHGYGAVKEMCLDRFAERFAAAGLVVLVFDYRFTGASGGLPRERRMYYEQHSDFRNAITWVSLQAEVDADRIGMWGTSFSGGHALHLAAFDRRIKAVVAQAPATNTWETYFKKIKPEALAKRAAWLASARREEYVSGVPQYAALVAPEGQPCVMPQAGAYEWFTGTAQRCAPNWRNQVTVESLEINAEYAPVAHMGLISPTPMLMLVAEEDIVTPVAEQRKAFAKAKAPKRLVELPGGHFEGYQEPGFENWVAPAVEWFGKYLL